MKSMAPVNVIMYHPKTPEGKEALAKRVADAHASSVIQQLKTLNCPTYQKQQLLDAIIDTTKRRNEKLER